jgi:hypothetical protein
LKKKAGTPGFKNRCKISYILYNHQIIIQNIWKHALKAEEASGLTLIQNKVKRLRAFKAKKGK